MSKTVISGILTPVANTRRKNIEILFFDAGGGHRSAAEAIQEEALKEGRPWNVVLVNANDILGSTDLVRRLTGKRAEEIYNLLYQKEWTFGMVFLLRILQFFLRLIRPKHIQLLVRHFKETHPDMVVSVTPNFNYPFAHSVRDALPDVPFIILPTDYADIPPRGFYFDRLDCYAVCSTETLAKQAVAAGMPENKVFRLSGPIVNPRFYQPRVPDLSLERKKFGLDPDRPTGLVIFGSYGSEAMLTIFDSVASDCAEAQLIFICGKNELLAEKLRSKSKIFPVHIEGFTREIPYFMDLADFYIGKTGGLILSEAIVKRLPVITVRNSKSMIQELPNIAWVETNKAGLVLSNYRETGRAIKALLQGEEYASLKSRVSAINNRGIFELTDILSRILEKQSEK